MPETQELLEYIKDNIIESYIFVRYMGPKFVIVFCGVDTDSASDFINELKEGAEALEIEKDEENFTIQEIGKNTKKFKKKGKDIQVSPTLNFVVSTYYKGTGIETVLQKLEKYIDESN